MILDLDEYRVHEEQEITVYNVPQSLSSCGEENINENFMPVIVRLHTHTDKTTHTTASSSKERLCP